MTNSEDPDEIQHDTAFHQSLHCSLILKQPSWTELHSELETSTVPPSLIMQNGQSHTYCIILSTYPLVSLQR